MDSLLRNVSIALVVVMVLAGCVAAPPASGPTDGDPSGPEAASAAAPTRTQTLPIELALNELTPGRNMVYLHAQNAPRVYWLSTIKGEDKIEMAKHDMDCAGYNSLAVALGTAVSEWHLAISPVLPRTAFLDVTKPIHVQMFICPFFNQQDIGSVTITTKILNGEKVVAEGDAKSVIYQANIVKLEWDLMPKEAKISSGETFDWYVRAEGVYVAGIGLGICRKCETQSSLTFPVV